MIYLDSSALVKLVVQERESRALLEFLPHYPSRVACSLVRTEVPRAVRHLGPGPLRRARQLLERIDLIRVDDSLLDAAAAMDPAILRSLDAVHLAAAERVAGDLKAIVTYDQRMTDAAVVLGLRVESPG